MAFADNCIGSKAAAAVKALAPGQILVLENTRFHAGEEANDPAFAKSLAELGEVYVNDAFSASHRAHASTEGITHVLPSGAGRLMQTEIETLVPPLGKPERPLAAIVGGSKILPSLQSCKILMARLIFLFFGGAMANTFLVAKGIAIGKSLSEPDMIETAREIMAKAESRHCHIVLPKDVVVASALKVGEKTTVVPVASVPADQMISILVRPRQRTSAKIWRCAKPLCGTGPLGAFEIPPFDRSHQRSGHLRCGFNQTRQGLFRSHGGDTAAALVNAGVLFGVSYLSMAAERRISGMAGRQRICRASRRCVRPCRNQKPEK